MNEYLYLLSNPSMPDLLKIGMTTNQPTERMQQLFTTGVPEPFVLEFYFKVPSGKDAEDRAHNALANFRLRDGREFFKISVTKAVSILAESIGDHIVQLDRQLVMRSIELEKERREKEALIEAEKLADKFKAERIVQQLKLKTNLSNSIKNLQGNLEKKRNDLYRARNELGRLKKLFRNMGPIPLFEKKPFWAFEKSKYDEMCKAHLTPWIELKKQIENAEKLASNLEADFSEQLKLTTAEIEEIQLRIDNRWSSNQ